MPNNQLRNLASLGRYGDTMLAHINPQEAALLKARGGAGTINPRTGLREFFDVNFLKQFQPQPEPLPSLGQALDPNSLANLSTKLNEVTIPSTGFGLGIKPATQQISPEYLDYADRSAPTGMGGGRQVQGYTIPTEQTFQGKPLVAQYDAQGNFKQLTLQPGEYLTPDPSRPNIASVPKINAQGQLVDYGVFDLSKQDNGGFGSFVSGLVSDLGPMILAGIGANLFTGANLLGDAAGAAGGAAGGASAADIAAHEALANANLASQAGGLTAAGAGGTLTNVATSTPVVPQTSLTGTPLTDLASGGGLDTAAGGATAAGSASAADIAAHEALATANTAGGLTSDAAAAAAAGGGGGVDTVTAGGGGGGGGGNTVTGGASAEDIAAHDALAQANAAAQASGGLTAASSSTLKDILSKAGIPTDFLNSSAGGNLLSSLLSDPKALAAIMAGAGNVASGIVGANAAKSAAQIQADAATRAAQIQQDMFNTVNAQGAPYRGAGYNALNLIGSMLPGQYTQYDASGKPIGTATGTGYLTQQYSPEQFQKDIDPGYAFRLQQGQMANQRASNLAGGLIGGNALQGLQDYTQGMASQEYGNAFNRFQTQRGNIYNTLAGIAGIGQTAQGQANQLAQNTATAQGQLGIGTAAAQAAGKMGQAAGYGGALTGAGNAYLLSQILNQNQGAAASSGSRFMDTTG